MKMHIDTDVCTGHGVWEGIRPDIFEVGDDGTVHLVTEDFTEAIGAGFISSEVACSVRRRA
jgi:ferredoxin